MSIREALLNDIEAMHRIRVAVKENRLSRPDRITFKDYEDMIMLHGKGWVFETEGQMVGFAFADATKANIWALFVLPGFEGQGIGRSLLATTVKWLFDKGLTKLWLTTEPNTRAAGFYAKVGWVDVGMANDEIKFELTKA